MCASMSFSTITKTFVSPFLQVGHRFSCSSCLMKHSGHCLLAALSSVMVLVRRVTYCVSACAMNLMNRCACRCPIPGNCLNSSVNVSDFFPVSILRMVVHH